MSLGALTWLGHSTFVLETPGGTRVLFDPWVTGNPATPEGAADPGRVDLILVSHGHADHTGDLTRLAAEKTPQAVIGMVELMGWFESQGVANTVGINKGGSTEAAGQRVTLTQALHSSSVNADDGAIVYTGEPAGFILTIDSGYKVYFAGDTTVFGDMSLIGELYAPDLAILPIGDFFTMGPFEAAKAVELLGTRRILGMHYGTFPVLPGTPQQLREACAARGLDVTIEELEPGGTLR
jgi:L-ascorbate metabolism protein UlaG (beta-lactamase superfamily)